MDAEVGVGVEVVVLGGHLLPGQVLQLLLLDVHDGGVGRGRGHCRGGGGRSLAKEISLGMRYVRALSGFSPKTEHHL